MNRKERRRAAALADEFEYNEPVKFLEFWEFDNFTDPGVLHCSRCRCRVKNYILVNREVIFCDKCSDWFFGKKPLIGG